MRIANLLATIDEIKPNQFSNHVKTQWLNEIEFKVVDQIINMAEGNNISFKPYDYDTDAERELYAPDVFADIYSGYISAKIDYHLAELDRYNIAVAMYQAAFEDFAAWYRRKHVPKQRNSINPF